MSSPSFVKRRVGRDEKSEKKAAPIDRTSVLVGSAVVSVGDVYARRADECALSRR
jgi:hypothetical protein